MQLSLCGWSLNHLFTKEVEPLKWLDFPLFARERFGIDALELNNIYFASSELTEVERFRRAAEAAGSRLLNIAVDVKGGDLSSADEASRLAAVEAYAEWIPVAAELGCGAIRANSGGRDAGNRVAAATDACVDSFRRLADVGVKHEVAILIENHWGISSDPAVMTRVVGDVRRTHGDRSAGTLVDWGNWPDSVDRYAAIEATMPQAMAVHAKVNDIDEHLNHPRFDHKKCLRICRAAGYDGYLGIEYEGSVEPVEGIQRGIRLMRSLLSDATS